MYDTVTQPGYQQVSPGQTVQSTWGNTVWNQTLNRFASAADRDAQWPAPPNGAICYLADLGLVYVRRSGAWAPLGPTYAYPVPTVGRRLAIQVGRTTITTDGAAGQANVTFPTLFGTGSTPTVVACPGNANGGFSMVIVNGVSADPVRYFTVICRNNAGALMLNSALVINWTATGEL